ncbi:MAG: hypothetical protein QOF43_2347, partial [Gaiellaceae bacterium]|nr:hypothetical protein [Gaiellaceae bacterium]
CLVAALGLATAGCGGAETTGNVSWSTAVALVRDCKVKRVDQTHARLVTVTLRSGGTAQAREPRIDAIIPVVNRAGRKCGPIIFSTE